MYTTMILPFIKYLHFYRLFTEFKGKVLPKDTRPTGRENQNYGKQSYLEIKTF